ncbi:hypothetical protein LEMLEM_LOCUS11459 [Lemmus lemmus]
MTVLPTGWRHTIHIHFLPGKNFTIAYFRGKMNYQYYQIMMLMASSFTSIQRKLQSPGQSGVDNEFGVGRGGQNSASRANHSALTSNWGSGSSSRSSNSSGGSSISGSIISNSIIIISSSSSSSSPSKARNIDLSWDHAAADIHYGAGSAVCGWSEDASPDFCPC